MRKTTLSQEDLTSSSTLMITKTDETSTSPIDNRNITNSPSSSTSQSSEEPELTTQNAGTTSSEARSNTSKGTSGPFHGIR